MGYSLGEIVKGKVNKVRPYGLFLNIPNGVGLLHISEISNDYIRDIERFATVGDELSLKIIDIDPTNGFLKFSFKQVNDSMKFNSHDSSTKNVPTANQGDFSALKEHLPGWIANTLQKVEK